MLTPDSKLTKVFELDSNSPNLTSRKSGSTVAFPTTSSSPSRLTISKPPWRSDLSKIMMSHRNLSNYTNTRTRPRATSQNFNLSIIGGVAMLTKEMRFMMDVVVVGGFGFDMRMGKRKIEIHIQWANTFEASQNKSAWWIIFMVSSAVPLLLLIHK